MDTPIKILIVEDEMIIGANISLQLSKLGYEVSGIVPRGEDAINEVNKNQPDIILMDVQLKGNLDGIETAELIKKDHNIPIIYLTANTDEAHFKRAKATNPTAYISKPFKELDLKHAIELTMNGMVISKKNSAKNDDNCSTPFVLNDSIFVKRNDRMVKIMIADIYYFEADRNYCKIYSKNRECLLVTTLKEINEKLPEEYFLRIHRSYIVNLNHVDEVAGSHVIIDKKAIPMSKTLRNKLLKRVQTF